MKKKLSALLLAGSLALTSAGCGSIYDKEYVVVSDYVPAQQNTSSAEDSVRPTNFTELKKAILELVSDEKTSGSLIFTNDYAGIPADDLSLACWQARTQDALCAYCVENISYELSRIVSYDEAVLNISYADIGMDRSEIVRIPYSMELVDSVSGALQEGKKKLSVLVSYSDYDSNDVAELVKKVYRSNPMLSPRQPEINVNVFSGSNFQRLYEIQFRYSADSAEMDYEREQLSAVALPESDESLEASENCFAACRYLLENCRYSANAGNSVFSALVSHQADSEGVALAFVALCRNMGIDCCVVDGQLNRQEHCWNIVTLGEKSYHIDVSSLMQEKNPSLSLNSDDAMWGDYLWNVQEYPACTETLPEYPAEELPEEFTENSATSEVD